MASARYWRVVGVDSKVGALAITQAVLWGAAGALSAALTASAPPVAGAVASLTDGDLSEAVGWERQQVRAPGFALVWDAGTPVSAVNVRFGGAPSADAWVRLYTLQCSTDLRQWDTVGTYALEWPGAAVLADLPSGGDPIADLVVSRLMFDGSLGDAAGLVWFSSGGAAVMDGQGVGGSGALALTGAVECYIHTPSSSLFGFGVRDFCVEMYVRWDGAATECALVCMRDASSGVWNNVMRMLNGLPQWSNGTAWLVSSAAVPANVLTHVAVTRGGGRLRIFVGGVKTFDGADSTNISGARPCYIGAYDAFRGNTQLKGVVDFVRITVGAARYTSDFEPPESAGADVPPHAQPGGGSVGIGGADGAVSRLIPGAMEALALDVQYGGAGRIWGTTKSKGTSVNMPVKARVVLLHQRSKQLVRETWSDPTTGAFAFEGIDTRQEFLTLAEDAAGAYRPVAANRLVPEVTA